MTHWAFVLGVTIYAAGAGPFLWRYLVWLARRSAIRDEVAAEYKIDRDIIMYDNTSGPAFVARVRHLGDESAMVMVAAFWPVALLIILIYKVCGVVWSRFKSMVAQKHDVKQPPGGPYRTKEQP